MRLLRDLPHNTECNYKNYLIMDNHIINLLLIKITFICYLHTRDIAQFSKIFVTIIHSSFPRNFRNFLRLDGTLY